MKPLSEQELREKIIKAAFSPDYWGEDYELLSKEDQGFINRIVDLILSDRKAWGEYVIGLEHASNCASVVRLNKPNEMERLYACDCIISKQRQRNQGEKTDE